MGGSCNEKSGMRRFFIDKIEETVSLVGEEFRHAVNVRRIKKGDEVVLCDNTAYEYTAVAEEIGKNSAVLRVTGRNLCDKEAKTEVTLLCGYLKGDKTEYSVQKAVELGVKKIVVFRSEFCAAYMNENKLARLNKVSAEAAKQCGRSVAPAVLYADDFASALDMTDAENKLFACEFAGGSTADLRSFSGSTAVVVGSEGCFSQREAALAREKGFSTVWLGKRILRADTAAVAVLSVVMWNLGELK